MTPETAQALDVDTLAQEIRRVDGWHSLGAGALAEALMPFLRAQLAGRDGEATDTCQCGAPCRKEVLMRGGDNGWGDDASRTVLRYVSNPAPAVVSVDDAMVERALDAWRGAGLAYAVASPTRMRRALTAALTEGGSRE